MRTRPTARVTVWGDLACFTRPESRVERRTYPVITPSAANGVLASIFGKPEFDWRITEILVHNPIRYLSLQHNELKLRPGRTGIDLDAKAAITQRTTIALVDVKYTISAVAQMRPHATHSETAYVDQFHRRVHRGACFRQPVLGLRDYPAYFAPPTDDPPLAHTMDLGPMPLHVRFPPESDGRITAAFWNGHLDQGRLTIPEYTHVA